MIPLVPTILSRALILSFFCLLLSPVTLSAQGFQEVWRYTHPGTDAEETVAFAVDSGTNICFTGWVFVPGSGRDWLTGKLDRNGKLIWSAKFSGPASGDDLPTAIALDAADNIYVTGTSQGAGTGLDIAVVKYSPEGKPLWTSRFNNPANTDDFGPVLALDSSGSVYVGVTARWINPEGDLVLTKHDSQGVQKWSTRYEGPAGVGMQIVDLKIDSKGGLHIAGTQRSIGGGFDIVTAKFSADGQKLWAKSYDGPFQGNDMARKLAVDSEGSAFVVGDSDARITDSDITLLKYDNDGALLWERRYEGPGFDYPADLLLDPEGNPILIGSDSISQGLGRIIRKYTSQGDLLWTSRAAAYGGFETHLALDRSNNLFLSWIPFLQKFDARGYLLGSQFAFLNGRALTLSGDAIYLLGEDQVSDHRSMAVASYRFTSTPDSPVLTNVSGSTNVTLGGALNLSASASGASPLYYQWRFNGAVLMEQTNRVLTLTNVAFQDNGSYSIIVSNSWGIAVSPEIEITILAPPVFSLQPQDEFFILNGDAKFFAIATGTPPLSYQWFHAGTPVLGGNSRSLSLFGLKERDLGEYYLVVTNSYGSARSSTVTLKQPNQPWVQTWRNQSATIHNDFGVGVAVGKDRSICAAASSWPFGSRLIKYAPDGSLSWEFAVEAIDAYFSGKPRLDAAGNIYWLSFISQTDTREDFFLCKIAPDSRKLWQRTFSSAGFGYDYPVQLLVGEEGNSFLGGVAEYSTSSRPGGRMLVLKVNPSGDLLWTASASFDRKWNGLATLGIDRTGNVLALGYSRDELNSDSVLVKFDSAGNELWRRFVAHDLAAYTSPGLVVQPEGDAVVSYPGGIAKYDPFGNQLWHQTFPVTADPGYQSSGLSQDQWGNFYLSGDKLRKFSASGVPLWSTPLPPNYLDAASLGIDSQGNVVAMGFFGATDLIPLADWDGVAFRYDSTGQLLWRTRQNQPLDRQDFVHDMAIGPDDEILIIGNNDTVSSGLDVMLTRYAMNPVPGGPVLLAQPRSQKILNGTPIDLRVQATGTPPISVQWFRDGIPLPGQTNLTLSFAAVSPSANGHYTTRLANANGALMTPGFTLEIMNPPAVSIGAVVLSGQAQRLEADVQGAAPLALQWFRDGLALPGATNLTLGLALLNGDLSGSYSLRASNQWGSSQSALLPVQLTTPAFFNPEISFTGILLLTNSVRFETDASDRDGEVRTVEFRVNGARVGTVSSPPFSFLWTNDLGVGQFTVEAIARDDQGRAGSTGARGFVIPLQPQILNQPVPLLTSPVDANLQLTVDASGLPNPKFQWRKNGANLAYATNWTLILTNAQLADSGQYDAIIANEGGAITTQPSLVRIATENLPLSDLFASRPRLQLPSGAGRASNTNATVETSEPKHAGKDGGHSLWATWTAPTNGLMSIDTRGSSFDTLLAVYQGPDLPRLTKIASDDDRAGFFTSLVRFPARAGQTYEIAIDGFGGVSGDVVLNWSFLETLEQSPFITLEPLNQGAPLGGEVRFEVRGESSAGPVSYQWYFNNLPLGGATSPVLVITNADPARVGQYVAAVSAGQRTVFSLPAALELGPGSKEVSQDKFLNLFAAPETRQSARNIRAAALAGFPSVAAGTLGSHLFDNFGASTDAKEPIHAGVIGGASKWFALTSLTNGTLQIDTIGSSFDTLLAVYSYTALDFFSLRKIASDDNSAPDGRRSLVRFPATAGTQYLVVVDGVDGQQGTIKLNWLLGNAPAISAPPPETRDILPGKTFLLKTTGTASPAIRYQWLKDGIPLPAQTNDSLTVPQFGIRDAGRYTLVATNELGKTMVYLGTFRAGEPLRLHSATATTSNTFQFQLSGTAPGPFQVQISTNLKTWDTYNRVDPGAFVLDPQSTNFPKRFFRALSE